jgi:inhibitor of cysteine peptidase
MVEKEVKKKSLSFAVLAILLAASFSAVVYFGYMPTTSMPLSSIKTFSSQNELNTFIQNNTDITYPNYFLGPLDDQFATLNPRIGTNKPATFDVVLSEGAVGYSTTNIQVAGVDEADFVKNDGQFIYVLSPSKYSLYIIDANPQNPLVLSKIAFGNSTILAGIFLSQDSNKITVLGSDYTYSLKTYSYGSSGEYSHQYYSVDDIKSFVKVYDISDKSKPVLTRDFSASGSYFNSRMIGETVYAVISQAVQETNGNVELPSVSEGTKSSDISPTQIYYVDQGNNFYDYYTYTTTFAININNDNQEPTSLTLMMGGTSSIYASLNNLYLTYSGPQMRSYSYTSLPQTEIFRIKLDPNDLTFGGRGNVTGRILNQYSMDEYNSYFRVATTSSQWGGGQNNVYVLDMNLAVVGKLENLASGENLHSARFMGDKCYLVTFQKIDPFFVIDLSQPTYPQVLGELKIPGYSDYLHPFDETHIIGVGKDTVERNEVSSWYQGLKLSLFDVSNVSDPKQISNVVIGDRGTDSLVLTDPKAFLFDQSRNLLVIPVDLYLISSNSYEPEPSSYGSFVWQGVYVYKLTLNGGFELRGNVTQIDSQANPQIEYGSWITRSLYIGNTLYTLSDQKIQLNSLEDMAFIAQIELT